VKDRRRQGGRVTIPQWPSPRASASSSRSLFTDVVGYTALTERDEAAAVRVRDRHREHVRKQVSEHGGELVDAPGDETLSVFASALAAVDCALALQAALRDDSELRLRIGIHLGDVLRRGGEVIGEGVNVAARIRPLAEPGGIYISEPVWQMVRSRSHLRALPRGSVSLKNVGAPVAVYALSPASARESREPKLARGGPTIRRAAIAGALAIAVVAASTLPRSWLPSSPLVAASVVVLPFADMSEGRDQEYFADGMTEEIINALARLPDLRVVARTSAFAFKGKDADIRTIGEQLGVRHVVEGSVRRSGEQLRVTAQLISVADGYHVWSETYERELADVFAIQEDVATRVAEALSVRIGGRSLAPRPTKNLRAYELYLTGRQLWSLRTERGPLPCLPRVGCRCG
jgi:adenylate cyclase